MKTIDQAIAEFECFLPWLDEIEQLDPKLWLIPIAPSTWSIREIITHMMFWDRYSLKEMLPQMKEGASLYFIDIEALNQQAYQYAQTVSQVQAVIEECRRTRQDMIKWYKDYADPSVQFSVDDRSSSFVHYLEIFIHHDQHHQKQINDFVKHHIG